MRKIIIILTALVTALIANAQTKWTLQQCVDTALANNRNIKQRELQRQVNEIAWKQSRNNLLPNLNASARHSWTYGRSTVNNGTTIDGNSNNSSLGLGANLTIFDGLKMKYAIDQRMAELKKTEAELEKIQQDIMLSVASAYLQVLYNKELLQIATDQYQLTENRIEQQKALVKAGRIAEGDLLELQAQLAKEEVTRTDADNNLKLALLDLAQILEQPNFETLDIEVPTELMANELQLLSAESVFESALKTRAEIKSAQYQLQSSEKNVLIAQSAYYPTLELGANAGKSFYNSQPTPFSTSVGFTLNVPIFNKLQVRNNVKTAKLEIESNKLNVENAKLELRKSIQQAYYNAVSAKAKWQASDKSVNSGAEAYRFAEKKYEGGRANVYELYQAKNNLARSKSEAVQAKYEYVFRLKMLELYK